MNVEQAKSELNRLPRRIRYLSEQLDKRGHEQIYRRMIADALESAANELQRAAEVVAIELESLNETLMAHQTNGDYDTGYEHGQRAAVKSIKEKIDKVAERL